MQISDFEWHADVQSTVCSSFVRAFRLGTHQYEILDGWFTNFMQAELANANTDQCSNVDSILYTNKF